MDTDRDRHTVDADEAIRDIYEEPSETEGYREDATEPVSTADQLAGRRESTGDPRTSLSGGDVDAATHDLEAGIETPGGSNPTPDQDQVDAIGASIGVTYQDDEPLKFGDKMADRDNRRWELNPASSEDYEERQQQTLPLQKQTQRRRSSQQTDRGSAATNKTTAGKPKGKAIRRATKTTGQGKAATTKSKRGTHQSKSSQQTAGKGLKRSGADVARKRSGQSDNSSKRKKTRTRGRS